MHSHSQVHARHLQDWWCCDGGNPETTASKYGKLSNPVASLRWGWWRKVDAWLILILKYYWDYRKDVASIFKSQSRKPAEWCCRLVLYRVNVTCKISFSWVWKFRAYGVWNFTYRNICIEHTPFFFNHRNMQFFFSFRIVDAEIARITSSPVFMRRYINSVNDLPLNLMLEREL